MLKVGLTGGIGSGKSTVAAIFETLGIPVYYADKEAKRLMNEDSRLKADIIKNFGEDCYQNGSLNKEYLASQVFNDKNKLTILNSIVHPATITDSKRWLSEQSTPYSIKEAALIFESHSETQLDYVIGVDAPESIRIQRVFSRDNISAEQIKARMNGQMNEEEKMSKCDFIIRNNEQELLIPQVVALHEKLLSLANSND